MNSENLGQNPLIWVGQFGMKMMGAILLWIIGPHALSRDCLEGAGT